MKTVGGADEHKFSGASLAGQNSTAIDRLQSQLHAAAGPGVPPVLAFHHVDGYLHSFFHNH